MNWRRGLLRVWLVLSVLWLCGTACHLIIEWSTAPPLPNPQGGIARYPWQMNWTEADQKSCADARTKNPSLGNIFDCFDNPYNVVPEPSPVAHALKVLLIAGVLPPLALLILGLAGRWIFVGFRPND